MDYVARTSVPVLFAVGESEQFVEVMIANDNVYEGTEQFQATLTLQPGSTGVVLGQQSQADAIIQDDDGRF